MDSREQTSWIFRHIGPPPTIADSVEVVELKHGSTTFGRGASADVYIDSQMLRNFISRHHAVVVGEWNGDGELKFTLRDFGLNGTYVNDVRIGDSQDLQEGDKVIFGHKNGYNVKVGERAEQPDSEFQFIFERLQPTKSVTPLQEQRQQESAKGKAGLDRDSAESSLYTPRRSGSLVSLETDEQQPLSCSTARKGQGSEQGNVQNHVRSSSKASSDIEHQNGASTKHRTTSNKESPSVREDCATKENQIKSKSPRRKLLQDQDRSGPTRRHSDDGVPTSFLLNLNQYSPRKMPFKSDGTRSLSPFQSPSPKCKHIIKSKSSDHITKTVPGENNSAGSPTGKINFSKKMSRSKLSGQEHSEHSDHITESMPGKNNREGSPAGKANLSEEMGKSRLSVQEHSEQRSHSISQGNFENGRSVSPGSSGDESLSPVPMETETLSIPPSFRLRESKSKIPNIQRSSSPRSRSPLWDQRSPGVYDEPPVLSPEYMKMPSSDVSTPSPTIYIERADDEYDEVDYIDRESMLFSIPPTPGKSFLMHSPKAVVNRTDDSIQERLGGDTSHRNTCNSSMFSSDYGVGVDTNEQDQDDEKCNISPAQSPGVTNKSPQRDSSSHVCHDRKDGSSSDQRQFKYKSLRRQFDSVKPDFKSPMKDKYGSDSDNERRFKKQSRTIHRNLSKFKQGQQDADGDDTESYFKTSQDSLTEGYRRPSSEKNARSSVPSKVLDRNVFEDFLSSDQDKSSVRHYTCKRLHNADTEGSDSSRQMKAAKLHGRPFKFVVEKENGLSSSLETSGRYTRHNEKKKETERHVTDGKLLKDVRVTVQRVTSSSMKDNATNGGNRQPAQNTRPPYDRNISLDKDTSSSKLSKTDKTGSIGKKVKLDLQEDKSLFGLEMEKLNAVRPKERPKLSRDKTLPSKAEMPTYTDLKNSKEKHRSGRLSDSSKHRERKAEKDSWRDKSKERKRHRERSQTPDHLSSEDETESMKPVHKIALRRPRQGTDNNCQKFSSPRNGEHEKRKAGRPSKKQKHRRKRKGSGEEDESLEDGVTWYEEETCESDHCFRPADRRVQWVCCDDCDKWYHTVCVGIFNLEDLKDEEYHCGCV